MADVQITYRTISRKERTGPVGRLLTMVANHPIRTGVLGGLVVVLIAAVRAREGVLTDPLLAIALSAVVIFTWTVLFYFMRSFFRQQTYFDVEVVREILLNDEDFLWQEHGRVLRAFSDPVFGVFTNPVPKEMVTKKGSKDLPWPVWLVISGNGNEGRFIIETKVTAKEAAGYEGAPPEVVDNVDEHLPVQVASPLLMLVRDID